MTAATDPDGIAAADNRAGISRTTCGWRRSELARDDVRRYWRDVHSPAIARRAGVYWYRHSAFDAVRTDLFPPVDGLLDDCPPDAQLMWQSDVVYLDDDGVQAFMRSPDDPAVTALLLADIEMIVERSTTYKSIGANARTYVDRTGDPLPIGPRPRPTFGVFLRSRGELEPFRDEVRALAADWAARPGVLRLRLNLFDVPDMEAERRAGYPVKTHPLEQQYQAWIELVLDADEVAATLPRTAGEIAVMHTYPVPATYTFVRDGAATLIGLRGFAAYEAITALHATHAADPALLGWMYGAAVSV